MAGQELYEEQLVYPWDFWIILLGPKSSWKRLMRPHQITKHLTVPFIIFCPSPSSNTNQLLFCFFFFSLPPASPILHIMNFYHNIGWGALHLLKCHQYQLCRWWLQGGNNIACPPPPLLQLHIFLQGKGHCALRLELIKTTMEQRKA